MTSPKKAKSRNKPTKRKTKSTTFAKFNGISITFTVNKIGYEAYIEDTWGTFSSGHVARDFGGDEEAEAFAMKLLTIAETGKP